MEQKAVCRTPSQHPLTRLHTLSYFILSFSIASHNPFRYAAPSALSYSPYPALPVSPPYHSSMIRADIAVKAIVIQCFCDRIHIQCSTGGRMCTFFKSIIQYLDISHMHKVDSSHCRIFCCHLCYIVVSEHPREPVQSVIPLCLSSTNFKKRSRFFFIGNNARQSKNTPAWIILMNCHVDIILSAATGMIFSGNIPDCSTDPLHLISDTCYNPF